MLISPSFLMLLAEKDKFMPAKRTKPSLSIVNPLDVLRQRLLLEMARRQMRENTKQVIFPSDPYLFQTVTLSALTRYLTQWQQYELESTD